MYFVLLQLNIINFNMLVGAGSVVRILLPIVDISAQHKGDKDET